MSLGLGLGLGLDLTLTLTLTRTRALACGIGWEERGDDEAHGAWREEAVGAVLQVGEHVDVKVGRSNCHVTAAAPWFDGSGGLGGTTGSIRGHERGHLPHVVAVERA